MENGIAIGVGITIQGDWIFVISFPRIFADEAALRGGEIARPQILQAGRIGRLTRKAVDAGSGAALRHEIAERVVAVARDYLSCAVVKLLYPERRRRTERVRAVILHNDSGLHYCYRAESTNSLAVYDF
jgi:hypothetical protein